MNNTKNNLTAIGIISIGILPVLLWFSIIVGWIMNIFDVMKVTTPIDIEEALHIIGIAVPPLGAIMGIFF